MAAEDGVVMRWKVPAGMALLLLLALLTRFLIIGWTLPYPENPAHEHSMFYDSRAIVRDQMRAFYALYHFPQGLITEAAGAYTPLLQRYISAGPLGVWLGVEHGFSLQAVLAAPFERVSYQTLVVNRVVSIIASVITIFLAWKLFSRYLPPILSFFLAGILTLSVSEIGLAIHEKTAALLSTLYLVEALLLDRWIKDRSRPFKYLWLAGFTIGVAGTGREYGLFFGGLLLMAVLALGLGSRWREYLSGKRLLILIGSVMFGIALFSPHMFAQATYWLHTIVDPGGSEWQTNSFGTIPQDMWSASKLLFGGGMGAALFWLAGAWALFRFRQLPLFVRPVTVWVWLYIIVMAFYPLKTPRFFAGVAPLALLLIGLMMVEFWKRGYRKVTLVILAFWFVEALLWGTSAYVFFQGVDNRLVAADAFHEVVPEGVSVATFFRPHHSRQIPVDERRYVQYSYVPEDSLPGAPVFVRYGDETRRVGVWPDYVLVQFEEGAYSYQPDQRAMLEMRASVIARGDYELIERYEKRRWVLGDFGLFGTRSRWAYLNPVVEVYQRSE